MNHSSTAHRISVYATGRWVGFHCWPNAPEYVGFLRDRHRHEFHWKVSWAVEHEDRQVEFCSEKDRVDTAIASMKDNPITATWSCESWATYLLNEFKATEVSVSEDGESGAVVKRLTDQNLEDI